MSVLHIDERTNATSFLKNLADNKQLDQETDTIPLALKVHECHSVSGSEIIERIPVKATSFSLCKELLAFDVFQIPAGL